ncbi:MAG: hypothetical protein ACR2J7_02910 [Luteimonas sp.]
MKRKRPVTSLMFAGITALMGCTETTAPAVSQQTPTSGATVAPSPVPVAHGAVSIASALPDAEYVIETTSNGKAPLKDGLYEEAIQDSSSKNIVQLGPEAAYGDLDGNRVEDAAVTLLTSSGGSGGFTYVAAVLNQNGTATPVDSVFIGDRITMKSLQIADGKIKVAWLDRKTGEPMSTDPSAEVTKSFMLQDGKMTASD